MAEPTCTVTREATGLVVSFDGLDWDDEAHRASVIGRLRELAEEPDPPTWWVDGPQTSLGSIADPARWTVVRTVVELRRSLPMSAPPEIPRLRSLRVPADFDGWLEVNNRSFAWHPEQGGWDRDRLKASLSEDWVRPEDVLVVPADVAERELDGFCWTRFHPETDVEPARGEVYVIAVHPDARGRGLARSLVLAGMDLQVRRHAATVATLWTESDNEPALALYRELGYRLHGARLALRPAEPT